MCLKFDILKTKEEKKLDTFFDDFSNKFNIDKIRTIKDESFIIKLYETFMEDIYVQNKFQKIVLRNKIKLKEQLQQELTEDVLTLINKLEECEAAEVDDLMKQAFIFGYAMSNHLNFEAMSILK